jgi:hypothetical protein
MQKGPRKIKDFLGQRGGEEDHVAIPTVTNTCKLMYHLKAEKDSVFRYLKLIALMG